MNDEINANELKLLFDTLNGDSQKTVPLDETKITNETLYHEIRCLRGEIASLRSERNEHEKLLMVVTELAYLASTAPRPEQYDPSEPLYEEPPYDLSKPVYEEPSNGWREPCQPWHAPYEPRHEGPFYSQSHLPPPPPGMAKKNDFIQVKNNGKYKYQNHHHRGEGRFNGRY